jgi:hypothetical protein
MFKKFKGLFFKKSNEEMLALGKYVWQNRSEKIKGLENDNLRLKVENDVLRKKLQAAQNSLRQEISFSSKMLNERRLRDVKGTQGPDSKPRI